MPSYSPFLDRNERVFDFSRHRSSSTSSASSTRTLGRDEAPISSHSHPQSSLSIEIPDDIDDVFADEVVDLTVEDSNRGQRRILQEGEYALESLTVGMDRIRIGDCVEVQEFQIGKYKCHFILIKVIAQTFSKQTIIRGLPMARTRCLHAKLPKKQNELCQLHLLKDGADDECPVLSVVNPNDVVRKRDFIVTNARWPKHNLATAKFQDIADKDERNTATEAWGTLVCRWMFKISTITHGSQAKPVEDALIRIHASQVTDWRYRDSEEAIANQWRGDRIKGGSWLPGRMSGTSNLDLDLDLTLNDSDVWHSGPSRRRRRRRRRGQKYTVFDSFSGAGGVSCGAQMAGYKIEYAIDKAREVWDTYRTNFPDTRLYRMSIHEFIQQTKSVHIRVDILHLSPPCQYFSPAHTHQSIHDDENIFALLSGIALIEKLRPRIITIEQTFGITHDRHKEYMQNLVGDLTYYDYSVRWKVVRLCAWGAAQDRKRLVVIAAGPGETLPPFPSPTHSENGGRGLKTFTTIDSVLRGIRPGSNLHDVSAAKKFVPPRASYSGDRLAGTLTTSGSELYHPSGRREFTLRECASLQGFPLNHRFLGNKTSIKKQIGNAFPPNTVRVLYAHLENWLLKEDGMTQAAAATPTGNVIVLDGDDNFVSSTSMPSVEINTSTEVDDEEHGYNGPFHFMGPDHRSVRDSLMIDLT